MIHGNGMARPGFVLWIVSSMLGRDHTLPICNFSVILTLELSCTLCYNLIAGHLRDPLPLYV